jgi:Domain of Unknown Function with PDB structure (DUF3857)/Transglutaminase-like superfamily
MRYNFTLFITLFFTSSYAQNAEYPIFAIADSLKQNANAIVRLNQLDITISSQRSMSIKTKRIISILNEKGLESIDAVEHYDKSSSIKDVNAKVYNAFGKEIKKLRRKDFKDQAAVDGVSIFTDSRLVYLDYTPTEYPFTIVYESEMTTSNTAFIPNWSPLNDYYLSVEKSILTVNYLGDLGFKKKEFNFQNYKIKKTIDSTIQLSYLVENILAQKNEEMSPRNSIFPKVMMALESFHLEGVDGNAKTWKEYGKWYYDKVLFGTLDLSEETKAKIKNLVGNEKDPIKKAKIIYDFVQQKSRYVSIQVGIGGWKPMLAKDVDRLGYGDCKALTNYTKALLHAVDVPSYNTVLYGDRNKRNIESDLVSMQGNHMILSIPNGDNYVWLECTSQDDPFGYQGTFTDDREVLIIKPDGGEIVHTKIYTEKDNSQLLIGNYSISENGDLVGKLSIVSEGSQYSSKFSVEKMSPEDKEKHYKDYFDNINNLKINIINFLNNKENISFTENLEISAEVYGVLNGNRMIFVVNAFNKLQANIKKIRNRKNTFEIQRGYYDNDQISISLPDNFTVEALPNSFELNSTFGEYKTEFIKKDEKTILYKRINLIKKGIYTNKEYEDYRIYMEQIAKNDNSKIILIKK